MDTDLVKLAQNGDKGAFTTLAAARADRFLAASHRILRDFSLAEDATQQALLSIWRDLPQLRDPARFDAWSYRLLVRACYAEASETRRWTPNIRLLPADEPMAADELNTVVNRDQLDRGFRRLSLDHRTVVVLHHYLDLPLDEVAEALGIPVGDGCFSTSLRDARAAGGTRCRRTLDDAEGCAMSADRDVTRIVRSWLHEDAYEDADRILNLVLDEVDTTPQRRASWLARRAPRMNTALKIVLAAAAVVVVAVAVINFLPRDGGGVGGPDVASPSPTPGPSYEATRLTVAGSEVPGPALSMTVGLPEGWAPFTYGADRGGSAPPDGMAFVVTLVSDTFEDPCSQVPRDPQIGPTVDDLAAALGEIPNTTATDPVQTTIAGLDATYIEVAIPASLPCDPSQFYLLQESSEGSWWAQGLNETARFWIVEVAGQRVAILAHTYPGSGADAYAELDDILNSIVFDVPS